MARRPARAPPAEARPSGRHGRGAAGRGGGRRGKAGSSTSARASARSGSRWLSAPRLRRPIWSRSIPSWRGSPRPTPSATGFSARTRVLTARRSRPESAPRRPGWSNWPIASSPTRRSSSPGRSAPLRTKAGRARMSCRPRRPGATLADWISASLAILAPGGLFVMIHRPDALGADPRRDRRAARRAGASAGSSDHRLERASAAPFGGEGVQSAAAPCAGARSAWGRRPPHRRSGRDPSRRAAYRLGRPASPAGLKLYRRRQCSVLRATQSFQSLNLIFLQLEMAGPSGDNTN